MQKFIPIISFCILLAFATYVVSSKMIEKEDTPTQSTSPTPDAPAQPLDKTANLWISPKFLHLKPLITSWIDANDQKSIDQLRKIITPACATYMDEKEGWKDLFKEPVGYRTRTLIMPLSEDNNLYYGSPRKILYVTGTPQKGEPITLASPIVEIEDQWLLSPCPDVNKLKSQIEKNKVTSSKEQPFISKPTSQ